MPARISKSVSAQIASSPLPSASATIASAPQPAATTSSSQPQSQSQSLPQPELKSAAATGPTAPPIPVQHAGPTPQLSNEAHLGSSNGGSGVGSAAVPFFWPLQEEELTEEQRLQQECECEEHERKLTASIATHNATWNAKLQVSLDQSGQQWDGLRAKHQQQLETKNADDLTLQQFKEERLRLKNGLMQRLTEQLEPQAPELGTDVDEEQEEEDECLQELDGALKVVQVWEERCERVAQEVTKDGAREARLHQMRQPAVNRTAAYLNELRRLQKQLLEVADKQKQARDELDACRRVKRQRFAACAAET